jgi:general secretion pathway protein G
LGNEVLSIFEVMTNTEKFPNLLLRMDPAFNRSFSSRTAGGFTLLELLVVMVIIGLLAGYVAPRYFTQVGKSEVKTARAQIDALEKALETFRLDTGRYPTTEEGLAALMTAPTGMTRWQGPYLKKALPPDPWGNPYRYKQPGEHGDFDLYSYGRTGKPSGKNDDAAIVNW